jgi:hypothetical protein
MLTTNQKGLAAEQAVILESVKLGVGVSKPLDDERYDLILDLDSKLWRIQCKWAVKHNDVIVIRLYSNRRGPDGMITRRYSDKDVDGFAAYCLATEKCYFLPVAFTRHREVRLRIGPTLNNQSLGIRWASDYEFAAKLHALLGP